MNNFRDINFFGKKIDGRFVIPSGIRCAKVATIEKYFTIDSVGIITTKSISKQPKIGYREPLYVEYSSGSYINSVGLDNPGAEAFRDDLRNLIVPNNKFLLISIFGSNVDEFLEAAFVLSEFADGFELNLSCPHANGYGLQVGQDIRLVQEIVYALSHAVNKPIFVKLSASVPNLCETALLAVQNGASGITVSNTIGPSIEMLNGTPVLHHGEGGLSGVAIRPLAIKSVLDIRKKIGCQIPIIGMGGITTPTDIVNYHSAGADFFGIGSSLTGLDFEKTTQYLNELECSVEHFDNNGHLYSFAHPLETMSYTEAKIKSIFFISNDVFCMELSTSKTYSVTAGKFFFIMVPGVGEKPFAMLSKDDNVFLIRRIGEFTNYLSSLHSGDIVYLRGPYGKTLPCFSNRTLILVGGGMGVSALLEIGKYYFTDNSVLFFLGYNSKDEVYALNDFEQYGDVFVSTIDGSLGYKGTVLDLMQNYRFENIADPIFINCGPNSMISNVSLIEETITDRSNILCCFDRYTSCGVGICGKCATSKGLLSCVDGPFFTHDTAVSLKHCNCSV